MKQMKKERRKGFFNVKKNVVRKRIKNWIIKKKSPSFIKLSTFQKNCSHEVKSNLNFMCNSVYHALKKKRLS